MRHGAPGRRQRNRGNGGRGGRGGGGGGGGNNRMQVFDSNGPDVRIRGTAYQIHEKYMALAKDANGLGDLILAESYLQHAEHYQRLINSWHDSPGYQSHYHRPQQQEGAVEGEAVKTVVASAAGGGEDLGLPASILGETPRTAPVTGQLEDA